ncbi:glycosyltransferase family A protein [Fibrobacter sp. UWB13]|uniref:glycosyltransferase family A protein n=1 Tax=Fibrobacter sp. UWB13 TaxID=1896204 RepID=UPI000A0EC561|nr:glycosyltransferase family A protein [Fibrobacter sp. UWB13]SMG16737.1 Glycosyl transferase family 2 [Fibrobacter sp. UWB13]
MSQVEVLISAMNQNGPSIFRQTNIQSSALMVNQCDVNDYWEQKLEFGTIRIFSTKDRGLSRSRNMAVENASKKYALLCDDDEYLYKDYPQLIETAFADNPKADVICFQVKCPGKKYSSKSFKLGYITTLRIASWQICFRLESVRKANIVFDTRFGSGTVMGSGEENIFLYDCLKNGLNIYYVPICIGEVSRKKSNWFKGFTQTYFFNRGKILRRMMGSFWGGVYCVYFVIAKHRRYKKETNFANACKNIVKGFFSWSEK